MTVVTFEDYTPSPRYDGTAWTSALIQEAPAAVGPWMQIEQKVFTDPDVDPTKPKSRSFTTHFATLNFGWYRIVFVDSTGGTQQPTAPVYNGAKLEYEPTINQVARKVLARTRDKYGQTLGTFNQDTSPTDLQVQEIVDDVITEVADVVGDDIPDALIDDAANVVAIRAAMQVELDFFADQVNSGRSIYPQLQQQFKDALASLTAAVTAAEAGDGSVVPTGPAMSPSYDFPEPGIGFKTIW